MGDPKGFMTYEHQSEPNRPVEERVRDWKEIPQRLSEEEIRRQGARCMDCGIPFCHSGCPLGNLIPDFNDLVYRGRWREAIERLHATNNFPEFTGRVCPAPCETACVLGINEPPVAIKLIEKMIGDQAWAEGWIRPEPPKVRTGKRVAVVGSGPAGLAAAQQLNRAGHEVTVYERDDRIGGLMVYGIPDFKMEKYMVERRVDQMSKEGVRFEPGVWVGRSLPADQLAEQFDAIVLTTGATKARDLDLPGRELSGIHLAMDFLTQQNRRNTGVEPLPSEEIRAEGKDVVVLGGGDTGSDCVGTAIRQGAASVTQLELMPKPPLERTEHYPWPYYPMILRTSSSHEEGCEREWSIMTKRLSGDESGRMRKLHGVRLEWQRGEDGRLRMEEIPGSEFELDCDLLLLALGFLGPETTGIAEKLGLELDGRGNIRTDGTYQTVRPGVFAAGDARRGQSLVVWALAEGRDAAREVDLYLMGESSLPEAYVLTESLPRR